MTDMYQFKVLKRNPRTGVVTILVKIVYEDAGDPNNEIYFAFQVLYDFLREATYSTSRNSKRKKAKGGFGFGQAPPAVEEDFEQDSDDDDDFEVDQSELLPPLADEFDPTGWVDEKWQLKNASGYIASSEYDTKNKTLIITPTHPGWTEQCRIGLGVSSAAYLLRRPNPVPGDENFLEPLTPIDRSKLPVAGDDPDAGFRIAVPRQAMREYRDDTGPFGGHGIKKLDAELVKKNNSLPVREVLKIQREELERRKALQEEKDRKEKEADPIGTSLRAGRFGGFGRPSENDTMPMMEMKIPMEDPVNYVHIPLKPGENPTDNLLYKPIMHVGGFGGGAPKVGLLFWIDEEEKNGYVYHESPNGGGYGSSGVNISSILGTIIRAKPRDRLPAWKPGVVVKANG